MVIYHGSSPWNFSPSFEDLFDCPSPGFSLYVPKFEHILHDISHLEEGELKGTIILQAVQLLLKYIKYPELRDRLPEIVGLLGKLQERDKITEYLQVILEYVFQAAEHVDVQDVRQALDHIPQGESVMPTIAEKLRQEGMQQGIQQGMQEGMQQGRQQGRQEGMHQGELQGKRTALIKLMNRKFSLSPGEELLIQSVQDQAVLDQALESVLFAQDKAEVLGLIR